jgi:hypothetical protein
METLGQMISDVEESNILFYKPSETLWKDLSVDFFNAIKNKGIGNVQSQEEFNNFFSYVLPCGNLKTEIPMWLYYNLLKSRDTLGILEKTQALPSDIYDFSPSSIDGRPLRGNEKLLNWDYLISIDTIISLAEKNPRILYEHINICEIGAGWGRVGYYLTQVNKNISYCIFDIPHVLYVSHEYLKESVKHTSVYSYEESKRILKEDNHKPGIFFYTPHFLEEFGGKFFDLAINIASFQEMNPSQVSGYFKKIDFLSNALYTQQRYSDLDMCYENYPVYPNWNLLLDKDVNFHPLWFEKFYNIG